MKEKILSQFLRMTLFAIVVTLFMSVMVFYELFKKQVFDDLKTDAEFARYLINDFSGEDEFDVRVTWIAGDGSVLYDNEAGSLENHSDRPEYIEALKTPIFSSFLELACKIVFTALFVRYFGYWGVIWTEPVTWIIMVIPLIVMLKKNPVFHQKKTA